MDSLQNENSAQSLISNAEYGGMFAGSCGVLARTTCMITSKPLLKSAVNACLKLSSKGDVDSCLHGPIKNWDVSRVTDMSNMFRVRRPPIFPGSPLATHCAARHADKNIQWRA